MAKAHGVFTAVFLKEACLREEALLADEVVAHARLAVEVVPHARVPHLDAVFSFGKVVGLARACAWFGCTLHFPFFDIGFVFLLAETSPQLEKRMRLCVVAERNLSLRSELLRTPIQ